MDDLRHWNVPFFMVRNKIDALKHWAAFCPRPTKLKGCCFKSVVLHDRSSKDLDVERELDAEQDVLDNRGPKSSQHLLQAHLVRRL